MPPATVTERGLGGYEPRLSGSRPRKRLPSEQTGGCHAVDFEDAVAAQDQQVAVRIYGQRPQFLVVKARRRGQCPVHVSRRPAARHGADDAARVHLPHPIVTQFSDKEVARRVHSHTEGPIEAGCRGRPAIPAKPLRSLPATVLMIPLASTFRTR